jgi:uncharacterized protein YndB with AHSA1/START domain
MLKKFVLVGLAIVVVVPLLLLAAGSTRPERYAVTRSAVVAAPPAAVYAVVVDFHQWDRWSPWAHLDPAQRSTIKGEGKGATYDWSGNKDVGEGRMTIVEARPDQRVGIDLQFFKPFESRADTSFTLAPEAGGCRVTWEMSGKQTVVERTFGLFMDMEKMIGGDFERGLASLKREVETAK